MIWKVWTAAGLALACGIASAPAEAAGQKAFSGVAAYYDAHYVGKTSSGEAYDPTKFTCAHRTLPFGTRVRVTDPRSRRSVVVVVNDRGPFDKGRVIDLSLAAAKVLHMTGRGLMKVTAEVEPPAAFTTASEAPKR
jgi:peptidoglycan lytic transglycosylase